MSACPNCRVFNVEVEMTRRLRNGWIKRYRNCLEAACGHKYITFEIPGDELELPDDPEALKEIHLRRSR